MTGIFGSIVNWSDTRRNEIQNVQLHKKPQSYIGIYSTENINQNKKIVAG